MSYQWLNNPVSYQTAYGISQQMCKFIESGFGYPVKSVEEYDHNTDAVMYGILRGCTEIMEISRKNNRNYVNIDHGYFTKRDINPYFRFTRNDRHYSAKLLDLPSDRFDKHNLSVKDYKMSGKNIIILPPGEFWGRYSNIDHISWGQNIKILLQTFTDKEIIIKNKNDTKSLREYFDDAYAIVHFSSMGAIEGLIEGIPVLTLGPSFLQVYSSTDIMEINNLKLFDRSKLFNNLAYHQFTINEVLAGTAKSILNDLYKELDNE